MNKSSFYSLCSLVLAFLLGSVATLYAQTGKDAELVQLSGLIVNGEGSQLVPISYAGISVKGARRATVATADGIFSLVVRKGETVVFSAIGFQSKEYTIPADLEGNRQTVVQLLVTNIYNLPETVIMPWPNKEFLQIEFLALEPNEASLLEEQAKKNLEERVLASIGENMSMDGLENNDYYLRQSSRNMSYIGQTPPMPIFDPLAWARFFKAWKNGEFKRKDKK